MLITEVAGFIDSNPVIELLKTVPFIHIVGADNTNDYHDVSIKKYRLNQIEALASKHMATKWMFVRGYK